MSKKPAGEEIRRRIPRLTMSLVMAIIFFMISIIVPPMVSEVGLPGLSVKANTLVASIATLITAVFLIRALADALALADMVTEVIVKRLGIREKRASRRAARDLLYIIIIILIVTALSPVLVTLGDVGELLTTVTTLIALGFIIVLIYDLGRILYRIIEQRAESVAGHLAKMAEREQSE